MQQENIKAQASAPYTNTLGFKIIQQHSSEELPDDVKGELADVLAKISALDPSKIQSAVVVIRSTVVDANGKEGFNLVVTAVGAQDLVMGSSMMLNEFLVNDIGGPEQMPASIAGLLNTGQGCGDPECESCSPQIGVDFAQSADFTGEFKATGEVTGHADSAAEEAAGIPNGDGVTKH